MPFTASFAVARPMIDRADCLVEQD